VMSSSLFLWSAAVGVNRKDEVSAAAVAVAVIVGIWVALIVLGPLLFVQVADSTTARVWWVFTAAAPGAFTWLSALERGESVLLWLNIAIALVTHCGLAVSYVYRFGRIANREVASLRSEVVKGTIPMTISPPLRTPFAAVVWKQAWESGPLAAIGLVATVAGTLLIVFANRKWYLSRPVEIGALFIVMSVWMGVLVAMVIGIGAFLYDTESRLMTFWRSRPIGVDQLFAIKVFTALLILVFTIFVPAIAALAVSGPAYGEWRNHFSGFWVAPAAQLAVFSAAAAMTCIVRHAIYGAILSVPAAVIGPALFLLALEVSPWHLPNRHVNAYFAGGFLVSFAANLLLAWLAFRNDWGRKGRY
jgi:hypothetical protein